MQKRISNEEYHGETEHISKSGLDKLHKSPFHFKNRTEFKETPQMVFGRAAHHFILEPATFAEHYVVGPNVRKNTNVWKDFVKENSDKEIISEDEYATLKAMENSVFDHPKAGGLLAHSGTFEESFFGELNGVKVKCRPDWYSETFYSTKLKRDTVVVVDLKTAKDAEERRFTNAVFGDFRYHVQAALYTDLMRELGVPAYQFFFIVVEKEPPYPVAVYNMSQDALEIGRAEYMDDLRLYKDCMSANEWPSYNENQVVNIYPPAWLVRQTATDWSI